MTDSPFTDGGTDDDSTSQSLQVTYSLEDDESPSTGVVKATAILTDTSPLELEPLYDVIDPDHLDGLFQAPNGDAEYVELTFTYSECTVTVTPETVRVGTTSDET